MSYIKDIIYIISFIGVSIGWYIEVHDKNTKLETDVAALTAGQTEIKALLKEDQERDVKQSELNGQFVMYIKLDSE